jgi:membrane protein implicated in regulation of membrane protease activity
MLRSWVIALGAAALVLGLILAVSGFPPAFVFLMWGVILVVGILIERFRYKPLESSQPGPGWERTTERFVDDESGQLVTVYVQPGTGERKYVRE